MADLEEFFKEQIKPYEERLKKLEELDKKKRCRNFTFKSSNRTYESRN